LALAANLILYEFVFGWLTFETSGSLKIMFYSETLSMMQRCLLSFRLKLGLRLIGKAQCPIYIL